MRRVKCGALLFGNLVNLNNLIEMVADFDVLLLGILFNYLNYVLVRHVNSLQNRYSKRFGTTNISSLVQLTVLKLYLCASTFLLDCNSLNAKNCSCKSNKNNKSKEADESSTKDDCFTNNKRY